MIKMIKKINQALLNMQRVPITAKIFFLQNISIMVKAGIPLTNGLEALNRQTKNKKLKNILGDLVDNIKKGKNLSESLAPYQKDFGEIFINMISAGEISGRLDEVLAELYVHAKKDHELKMKIKNALIYPAVILTAMIAIGIFVIVFVLPNLISMFKELDIELPLATRILIGVHQFIYNNGLIVALITLITIVSFIKIIHTKKGKIIVDTILLKIPIVSNILKQINLAQSARSLSALIQTDIDIVRTLEITSRVASNSLYKKAFAQASEKIKKGIKLEEILKEYPQLFPPVITEMIAVGEETGALDDILKKMADFYEEEVSQTMEGLPTIIEPVLVLIMGVAMAIIALAIMMPMYTMTEAF